MALEEIKQRYHQFRDDFYPMRQTRWTFTDDPAGTRVSVMFSNRHAVRGGGKPSCRSAELGVFTPEEKPAFYRWIRTILPNK